MLHRFKCKILTMLGCNNHNSAFLSTKGGLVSIYTMEIYGRKVLFTKSLYKGAPNTSGWDITWRNMVIKLLCLVYRHVGLFTFKSVVPPSVMLVP